MGRNSNTIIVNNELDMGKVAAQAIENHRSLLIQSGVQVVTEELDCTVSPIVPHPPDPPAAEPARRIPPPP